MDRRNFLKTTGAAAGVLALSGSTRAAQKDRPNIVIVMADDMGYSDIGCYGSEIQTPNLDRMASEGLRFRNFYNAARCCPTRASLLTGLYPHQAGIGHMTASHGDPAYQGYLNDNCVTLAEALKPAGYHTLMSGKWHVGAQNWPTDRGFDEFFGIISGSSNYFKPGKKSMLARNRELVEADEGFYTTDDFTDQAIRFIGDYHNRDENPYLLYLAYNAPHWPLHAWSEDIARYEDRYLSGWDELREERYERMIRMGVIDPQWELTPRDRGTPPWSLLSPRRQKRMARKMAVYAAMVDRMDQNIGRLARAIESTGQADNTLVLFLSDNGGCHEYWYTGFGYNPAYAKLGDTIGSELGSEESFASYGRGWSNASNTPFKLHKHWTHEGGMSTPLIAYWPGRAQGLGGWSEEKGHVIDIMATCLDAAGAEYPARRNGNDITPLEGKSLLPVIERGSREGHEALFWEHEGNRAVRTDEWKMVSDYPESWRLYDMRADRTEMHDQAGRQKEVARDLEALYLAWADRVGVKTWNPLNTFKY